MRLLTWMACGCAAAVLATALPAAQPSDALVQREASWSKALVARDVPALKQIIAPDWTGQNETGKRTTRDQFLSLISSGKLRFSAMSNHDVRARVMGDMAIVQGMNSVKGTYQGKPINGEASWTDVFQKRGGRWVAVASQNTPVSLKM
ncbi:MAG TPA: nuclear transport factor 2 family protein [Sphingomonas sp.]|nr:nuclear transport factor 2 family protein [Sphingomonas sp.]